MSSTSSKKKKCSAGKMSAGGAVLNMNNGRASNDGPPYLHDNSSRASSSNSSVGAGSNFDPRYPPGSGMDGPMDVARYNSGHPMDGNFGYGGSGGKMSPGVVSGYSNVYNGSFPPGSAGRHMYGRNDIPMGYGGMSSGPALSPHQPIPNGQYPMGGGNASRSGGYGSGAMMNNTQAMPMRGSSPQRGMPGGGYPQGIPAGYGGGPPGGRYPDGGGPPPQGSTQPSQHSPAPNSQGSQSGTSTPMLNQLLQYSVDEKQPALPHQSRQYEEFHHQGAQSRCWAPGDERVKMHSNQMRNQYGQMPPHGASQIYGVGNYPGPQPPHTAGYLAGPPASQPGGPGFNPHQQPPGYGPPHSGGYGPTQYAGQYPMGQPSQFVPPHSGQYDPGPRGDEVQPMGDGVGRNDVPPQEYNSNSSYSNHIRSPNSSHALNPSRPTSACGSTTGPTHQAPPAVPGSTPTEKSSLPSNNRTSRKKKLSPESKSKPRAKKKKKEQEAKEELVQDISSGDEAASNCSSSTEVYSQITPTTTPPPSNSPPSISSGTNQSSAVDGVRPRIIPNQPLAAVPPGEIQPGEVTGGVPPSSMYTSVSSYIPSGSPAGSQHSRPQNSYSGAAPPQRSAAYGSDVHQTPAAPGHPSQPRMVRSSHPSFHAGSPQPAGRDQDGSEGRRGIEGGMFDKGHQDYQNPSQYPPGGSGNSRPGGNSMIPGGSSLPSPHVGAMVEGSGQSTSGNPGIPSSSGVPSGERMSSPMIQQEGLPPSQQNPHMMGHGTSSSSASGMMSSNHHSAGGMPPNSISSSGVASSNHTSHMSNNNSAHPQNNMHSSQSLSSMVSHSQNSMPPQQGQPSSGSMGPADGQPPPHIGHYNQMMTGQSHGHPGGIPSSSTSTPMSGENHQQMMPSHGYPSGMVAGPTNPGMPGPPHQYYHPQQFGRPPYGYGSRGEGGMEMFDQRYGVGGYPPPPHMGGTGGNMPYMNHGQMRGGQPDPHYGPAGNPSLSAVMNDASMRSMSPSYRHGGSIVPQSDPSASYYMGPGGVMGSNAVSSSGHWPGHHAGNERVLPPVGKNSGPAPPRGGGGQWVTNMQGMSGGSVIVEEPGADGRRSSEPQEGSAYKRYNGPSGDPSGMNNSRGPPHPNHAPSYHPPGVPHPQDRGFPPGGMPSNAGRVIPPSSTGPYGASEVFDSHAAAAAAALSTSLSSLPSNYQGTNSSVDMNSSLVSLSSDSSVTGSLGGVACGGGGVASGETRLNSAHGVEDLMRSDVVGAHAVCTGSDMRPDSNSSSDLLSDRSSSKPPGLDSPHMGGSLHVPSPTPSRSSLMSPPPSLVGQGHQGQGQDRDMSSPCITPNAKLTTESAIFKKIDDMGTEPDRRPFLERLFEFMLLRDAPITSVPVICKQTVDLYHLYHLIKERGGMLEVTKQKKWREVSKALNLGTSSSAGFTLKRNYGKFLFPYECKFDRGDIDPKPILASLEASSKRETKKSAAEKYRAAAAAADQGGAGGPGAMYGPGYPGEPPPHMGPGYEGPGQRMMRPPHDQDQFLEGGPPGMYPDGQGYPRYDQRNHMEEFGGPYPGYPASSGQPGSYPPGHHRPGYEGYVGGASERPDSMMGPPTAGVHKGQMMPPPSTHNGAEPPTNYGNRWTPPAYGPQYGPQPAFSGSSGPEGGSPSYTPSRLPAGHPQSRFQSWQRGGASAAAGAAGGGPGGAGLLSPVRDRVTFPAGSVEATRPTLVKHKRLTHKDIGSVDMWRVLMSLRSGLACECTWALDVLTVLLADDHTAPSLSLPHLPGLLEVLLEHLRRYLMLAFPDDFEELEISSEQQLASTLQERCGESSSNTIDITPEMILAEPHKSTLDERNYTFHTRTGKTVVVDRSVPLDETLIDRKPWDNCWEFDSSVFDWQMGRGDTTIHLVDGQVTQEQELFNTRKFFGARYPEVQKMKSAESLCVPDGTPSVNKVDSLLKDVTAPIGQCDTGVVNEIIKVKEEGSDNTGINGEESDVAGEDIIVPKRVLLCGVRDDTLPPRSPQLLDTMNCSETAKNNIKSPDDNPFESLANSFDNVMFSCTQLESLKRSCADLLEDAYRRADCDPAAMVQLNENRAEIAKRCSILCTILRNLSFIAGNEIELCRHSGLLVIAGRLLQLKHSHPKRINRSLSSAANETSVAESPAKKDPSLEKVAVARETNDVVVSSNGISSSVEKELADIEGRSVLYSEDTKTLCTSGADAKCADSKSADSTNPDRKCTNIKIADSKIVECSFDSECDSASSEWWWDLVEEMRENAAILFTNISSHLDLAALPEEICLPILNGLLHIFVCPAAATTPENNTSRCSVSLQRLSLEALCKLCVLESNVDLVLATPPFARIVLLASNLVAMLGEKQLPVVREFAVSLLSSIVAADLSVARAVALQRSAISLLLDFIEEAERETEKNSQPTVPVTITTGRGGSRKTIEVVVDKSTSAISLDMVCRAAAILRHLADVAENQSLIGRQEHRLRDLVLSQHLDSSVLRILAQVLAACS